MFLFISDFRVRRLGSLWLFDNPGSLFETTPKIEIFEPKQIAPIFYSLKIISKSVMPGNTGDTKQTVRIPSSYTCFIAAIRRSMLDASPYRS